MHKKRSNEEWLKELSTRGQDQENALADLRAIILSGLPYALSNWLSPNDPNFTPFTEEVAQNTLLRVLDKKHTFEGRSQFTTWVHKIAIRIALTELRRQRWKDVSLDKMVDSEEGFFSPNLMADSSQNPETTAEQNDMLLLLQRLIMDELTEKQRKAMIAINIRGVPIEVVAHKMNMKRNALYKLMHDARLRLKRRMAMEGLNPQDVMSVFEKG